MDLSVPQNSVPSHSSGSLTLAAIIIEETLPPGTSKTFQKYAQTVFIPHVHSPVETIKRLDIVWDIFKVEKSLQEAQEGCVRKFHVKVEKLSRVLVVEENSLELFHFLYCTADEK